MACLLHPIRETKSIPSLLGENPNLLTLLVNEESRMCLSLLGPTL